jgi:regulator of protease activity HflC (stomatin/prohibitin superfamily)
MFNLQFVGAAESSRIRAIGEAEANSMSLQAGAYQDYGNAAVTNLILEALPKVLVLTNIDRQRYLSVNVRSS